MKKITIAFVINYNLEVSEFKHFLFHFSIQKLNMMVEHFYTFPRTVKLYQGVNFNLI